MTENDTDRLKKIIGKEACNRLSKWTDYAFNEIFGTPQTMTVKEVAGVLGTAESTIRNKTAELFPDVVKNGVTTLLTEEQVTVIKQNLVPRDLTLKSKVENAVTQLEKNETIIKAMMYLQQDNESLKTRAEKAEQQLIEQSPKVEFADSVMGSKDTVDVKEACKVLNLGIGRNRLFQFLRDESILDRNNQPYQRYIDSGYFRVIESRYLLASGEIKISLKTVVFQRGLNFIRARYAQREKEAS